MAWPVCQVTTHHQSRGGVVFRSDTATGPSGEVCEPCQWGSGLSPVLTATAKAMRHVASAPSSGTRPDGLCATPRDRCAAPVHSVMLPGEKPGRRDHPGCRCPGSHVHCGASLLRAPFDFPANVSGRSRRPSDVTETGRPARRGCPAALLTFLRPAAAGARAQGSVQRPVACVPHGRRRPEPANAAMDFADSVAVP